VPEDETTRTLEPQTDAGTVMGTAAYMSPEQAEAKPLDVRTDIFSFGAVLYEMATGRRAFSGGSQAAIISAVLNQEPKPLSSVAPGLPHEFERIVVRCLRKNPSKRQQHMSDVKVLLEELQDESESGKLVPAAAKKDLRRWPWVAAAATVAIMAAGAGLWLSRVHEEQSPRVVPLTTFAGSEDYPSFSPDGSQIVFSWNGEKQDNWDLYVKIIGSGTALRLTTDAADDLYPAWSPDGRQIAFIKYGKRTGIYLVSPLGGPEQKIADFDTAQGAPSWSADGKFLVVAKSYREGKPEEGAGAVFLVPVQGSGPRSLLVPATGGWYQNPTIAPAGRSLAFASCKLPVSICSISLVGLNADFLPQGRPRQLTSVLPLITAGLAWDTDGRSLIYSASSSSSSNDTFLWRLDVSDGREPKRLEMASHGARFPAVALNKGRLAFSRLINDTDVWQLKVGQKPQPLLVSSMLDQSAQTSSDGRRIAFASGRAGNGQAIWLANADGTGLFQLTSGPENYHGSPHWSPDGRWIAFDARGKEGRWNIKVVDSSGGQAHQLTDGPFSNNVPNWSHDGNWIYFGSNRTGRFEIWRVAAQGGTAKQITRDGGHTAAESPDAKTLYYVKTSVEQAQPLYARPLDGGEEKQVLERVEGRSFVVFQDGVYYLYNSVPGGYEIRFHDFASGHSRVVCRIDGQLHLGLSVSPDRKTFLFSRLSSGSDLMLIENFR
jgi:Tol biopolymer transport system component